MKNIGKTNKNQKNHDSQTRSLEMPGSSLGIIVFLVFIGFANVFQSQEQKTLVKPMFCECDLAKTLVLPMFCESDLAKTLVLPMFCEGASAKTLVLPMFSAPRSEKHWQNQLKDRITPHAYFLGRV